MTFNVKITTGLNSATPLGNTSIELGWSKPGSPIGDPGRLICTGKTSNSGLTSFSFNALTKELEGGKFYITARNGNDYYVVQKDFSGIRRKDTTVMANVHVPSKATIKIVYKNFAPVIAEDYFQCTPSAENYGTYGFLMGMKTLDGQSANTFFSSSYGAFSRVELTGPTAGDQYTILTTAKKKNGVITNFQDSIYIGKGQTKTYEVDY